jgi:SHS family lactate transporter-like MFS transporter
MISSASAQIEATGGDHLKTTIIKNGKRTVVPDYARVQGILIGVVSAYIIFLAIIGPECVPSTHPSIDCTSNLLFFSFFF